MRQQQPPPPPMFDIPAVIRQMLKQPKTSSTVDFIYSRKRPIPSNPATHPGSNGKHLDIRSEDVHVPLRQKLQCNFSAAIPVASTAEKPDRISAPWTGQREPRYNPSGNPRQRLQSFFSVTPVSFLVSRQRKREKAHGKDCNRNIAQTQCNRFLEAAAPLLPTRMIGVCLCRWRADSASYRGMQETAGQWISLTPCEIIDPSNFAIPLLQLIKAQYPPIKK